MSVVLFLHFEMSRPKVSPELKEEVTDTLREVKLRHLLKKAAMKSQKQTKTGLQQEGKVQICVLHLSL